MQCNCFLSCKNHWIYNIFAHLSSNGPELSLTTKLVPGQTPPATQHIVAACCSHIQTELQASFVYMLTTEYISSINIHACLLLNNTCLQFNLLPKAVQTNISYQIPTKTQGDEFRAPGQAPTNSPARPSPGWGKCSGPTWRWGNPDMVQKIEGSNYFGAKKPNQVLNVSSYENYYLGWFEPTSPFFAENPIHSLGTFKPWIPYRNSHGSSGSKIPPSHEFEATKIGGTPSWNPRKNLLTFWRKGKNVPLKNGESFLVLPTKSLLV